MDSEIVFLLINFSIVYSHVFFQFVCSDNFNIHLPLSPSRSGVHYFSLSFGMSPQPLRFVMDTGNSLVYNFGCWDDWLLDFKNNSVPCNSTQCNWFHPDQKCEMKSDCPRFHFPHDEESEVNSFSLLSENLTFPETSFDNFIVGCSNDFGESPFDDHMLLRIAGFGRAPYSLPAQMELDSFSYCMLSHDLYDNDKTTGSDLVLITKGGGGGGGSNSSEIVHYTPFIQNPNSSQDYYYVRLQNITVGNVNITVPDKYQIPDERGYGGTIVNSGTPYNFMEYRVFDLVADEFERQVTMKNSTNIRNRDAAGFGLCFNVWSFDDIPKLSLHFDGGAVMDLPLGNYFKLISHIGVLPYLVCMMTGIGSPLSDNIGEVQTIKVGNVNITVSDEIQIPNERSGDGGTIVNSGTPYNFIDVRMFYLFADEFERQVTRKNSNNTRNRDAEGDDDDTGFGLCFNVWSFDDIPKLSLHFDGGAVMQDLPLGNYFNLTSDIGELPYVVCMMTNTGPRSRGPAIVLGNYVQQNFYIQFDLKNNRLGLLNHTCTQI